MKDHRKKLQELATTYSGIEKVIAKTALKSDDLLEHFNRAISQPTLDAYLGEMTVATFFTRYYDQIESARLHLQEKTGSPVIIEETDTMTYLSSLAITILALEVALACGFEMGQSQGKYILKA